MTDDQIPEAQAALTKFLQDHAGLYAPDDEDGKPLNGPLVTGWVLLSTWIDDAGQTWVTGLESETMQRTQRKGMLHEALFGEEFR